MLAPTVHNSAKKGDIAKTVLMPGDPLRAKYIADTYLTDVVCYNEVRGMFGFTGKYKGVTISIQGSGMGVPSMGIYSRELFEAYDVDNIIRVGSAGSLANSEDTNLDSSLQLRDIVVGQTIDTDSNYFNANSYSLKNKTINDLVADTYLLGKLVTTSKNLGLNVKVGKIYTSDVFYQTKDVLYEIAKAGALAVEMETLALYTNALLTGKKAIAVFTVSDNPILEKSLTSKERQSSFDDMIKLALEMAIQC